MPDLRTRTNRARSSRRTTPLACLVLLLVLALVTACGGTPTATPAPADPTATPAPTATAPRPTATPPRPTPTRAARAVTPTVSGQPTEPPIVIGGASYARAGLEGQSITAVAVGGSDGRTLYAGGKGLSRSTDGGKTWTVVREEKEAPHVSTIVIAPSDPQVVYVGVSEGCGKGKPLPGFVTTDGGTTWKEIGKNIISIAVEPSNAKRAYVADCESLQRTINGGTTWEAVSGAQADNFVPMLVALAPSSPQTIYIVSGGETGTIRVRYSTDGGVTWTEITPEDAPVGALALAVDPLKPETVFISTLVGIHRTIDAGQSWALLEEGGLETTAPARPPEEAPDGFRLTTVLIADPDRSGLYWVGTGAGKLKGIGILRTRDGGETWRRSGPGIDGRLIQALAIGGPRTGRVLYAATDDGVWALTAP